MSGHLNMYLNLKPSQLNTPDSSYYRVNGQKEFQLLLPPNNRIPYSFTDIFHEHYNTLGEKLGKACTDCITSGTNVSVFTFGGPKSGKTFTLFGDSTLRIKSSLSHTFISELFSYTQRVSKEKTCSITLNFIDIHNNRVRDLGLAYLRRDEMRMNAICDIISNQDLEIKEATGKSYVQDVSILQVSKINELADIILTCLKAKEMIRSEGSTVLCVTLSQRVKLDVQSARACFVDFQQRVEESSSLDVQRVLNKVYMKILKIPVKSIPFKGNKITHLLQNTLVASAVYVITTIDTDPNKFKESQEALKFTKAILNIDKKIKVNFMNGSASGTTEWAQRLQEEIFELEGNIRKSQSVYDEKIRNFAKLLGIEEDLEMLIAGEKGSREYEVCKKFRESLMNLNNLQERNGLLEKKNEKYKKVMNDLQLVQTSNFEKGKKYLNEIKVEIQHVKVKLAECEEKKKNIAETVLSNTQMLEMELIQTHSALELKSALLNTINTQIESNTTDLKNVLNIKELGKTEIEMEFRKQILDNDYAYKQNLKSIEESFLLSLKEKERKIVEEGNKYRIELRGLEVKIEEFKNEAVKLFEVVRLQGRAIFQIEKGNFNNGISPVLIPRSHVPAVPTDSKYPLIFKALTSSFPKASYLSPAPKNAFKIKKPPSRPLEKLSISEKPRAEIQYSIDSLLTAPTPSASLSEIRNLGTQLQKLIKSNADKYSSTQVAIQQLNVNTAALKSELSQKIEEKERFKELYSNVLRKRIDSGVFTERPAGKTFVTDFSGRSDLQKMVESRSRMFRTIHTTVSGHRLTFDQPDFRPLSTFNSPKAFK